jgi:hypothetical protein
MTFKAFKCPNILLILRQSNIFKFSIFFSIILLTFQKMLFAECKLYISFFQFFKHMFNMHKNKLSDILDPDIRKTEKMKRVHYNLIAYFTLLKITLLSKIKFNIVWLLFWLTQHLFLLFIALFFLFY